MSVTSLSPRHFSPIRSAIRTSSISTLRSFMHYSHHPDIGSFDFATSISTSSPYVSGLAFLSMYGDIRLMYVHVATLGFMDRCGCVKSMSTVCSSLRSLIDVSGRHLRRNWWCYTLTRCNAIALPVGLKMITKERAEETCMIRGSYHLTSVEKRSLLFNLRQQ